MSPTVLVALLVPTGVDRINGSYLSAWMDEERQTEILFLLVVDIQRIFNGDTPPDHASGWAKPGFIRHRIFGNMLGLALPPLPAT